MKTAKIVTIDSVESKKDTLINGGKLAAVAIGGSAAGALVGKYSFPLSAGLILYGVHKGNIICLSAGLGMLTGSAYKSSGSINGMGATEEIYGFEGGINGFSFQDMITGAKQRMANWVAVNKSKVAFLPSKSTATASGKAVGATEELYINGFGQPEYVMGSADEEMGDTTEMTIASIGSVRPDADGSMLLGMDAMGRIL